LAIKILVPYPDPDSINVGSGSIGTVYPQTKKQRCLLILDGCVEVLQNKARLAAGHKGGEDAEQHPGRTVLLPAQVGLHAASQGLFVAKKEIKIKIKQESVILIIFLTIQQVIFKVFGDLLNNSTEHPNKFLKIFEK
jgi:hypothetical protein